MIFIQKYNKQHHRDLFHFLERCLPESDRILEWNGRHKIYHNIDEYFEYFWCMFDGNEMIGTVALKKISREQCELKSLYLLEKYHKMGFGFQKGCLPI